MWDMLNRWGQTGEFRNVPQDEFLAAMLDALKDMSVVDIALSLCWHRYHENNPPPAGLIKVLLEAPTQLGFRPHWARITQRYLDNHEISPKQGSVLLLKAARAGCLPAIFGKLRDKLAQDVWLSLVLAVKDAKRDDHLMIRQGLRKCKDHFDAESVEYMHGLVKTKTPKKLAPLIADVLPDDLPVATKWMSLCEGQKIDVAVRLCDNMMKWTERSASIDYWQARLDAIPAVRQEATDLGKAWLDLYQASLHCKIGAMLRSRGNEMFKIGFVETAAEKEEFDGLEAWLENPDNKVFCKDELLRKIRNEKDGECRKDGHIWHARLTRKLYESNTFKSVGVERAVGNKSVDILLEDGYDKDIHIEAWDGVTKLTHEMTRVLLTGDRFNANKLGKRDEDADSAWEYVRILNGKVKQLPSTGRNFVIAWRPDDELIWRSMNGVDLKDNVCIIQVVPPRARVWCKDWERMGETARLISESLGLEYYPIGGGW